MRGLCFLILASLWAASGFAHAESAASAPIKPPPLEAFGKLPGLEEMQISPDGDLLAFVTTQGNERLLIVRRIDDRKIVSALKVGKVKLRGLRWADDTHLLLTSSMTGQFDYLDGPRREWFGVGVFNVATGKQRMLLTGADNAMNVVFNEPAVRTINGKAFVFLQTVRFSGADGALALFRVDLDSGISSLVEAGGSTTEDWFVDRDGRALAEARYNQSLETWTLLVRRPDGGWLTSKTVEAPIDRPSIIGYAKDGQSLLVETDEDHRDTFHTVSFADGSWGAAEPDPYDSLFFDSTSHNLLGGVDLENDERRVDFFQPAEASIWKAIEKMAQNERVSLVSWTRNHRKAIVLSDGPRNGYGYALVDLDANNAKWLGDVYPDIAPDRIAQPKPILITHEPQPI
jgi:dipeptidyl aminopeptidase/acylaminoacyl peptidase